MTDLQWTNEPPTEEGHYLAEFTYPDEDYNGPTFETWLREYDGELIAFVETEFQKPVSDVAGKYRWKGPIPEPND